MKMRGFTMMEMVVVIAILGAVSGTLLFIIRDFYRSNAYVFEATTSVDSAQRGLQTALRDIREASYADDGNYPIATAATSSITLYSDTDKDGGIERIKLWIYNGTFYKVVTNAGGNPPSYSGQTSATTTIATYVRNASTTPLFKYYDGTGTQLATTSPDISEIASVAVTLMVDLNPNRAPNVVTMIGSATLRNLLDQ
ncbi:MAG TPA: type II secretion system protein [Candidatus Paceibacterota bacterium]|nr:type II secretion system protein [Candidatus Paceibacterota bacterium]